MDNATIMNDAVSQHAVLMADIREQEARLRHAKKLEAFDNATPSLYRGKMLCDVKIYTTGEELKRQQRVKQYLEQYVQRFDECISQGKHLIFQGQPGTGKTLLGRVIARELTEKHHGVVYYDFHELIEEFKENNDMSFYRRPELFIVDEVNIEDKHASVKEKLFRVIDERYQWLRPMLLITNNKQEVLEKQVGEKFLRRLLEHGRVLTFDWARFREKK